MYLGVSLGGKLSLSPLSLTVLDPNLTLSDKERERERESSPHYMGGVHKEKIPGF